ncbi:MAG: IclR family transcriptional regulator [Qingshengfaniella sp.]
MDSTLLKGLEVLERIVASGAPAGVSALARELGLPKSNVHRTLSSLRAAGYLLYDAESRRYFPSLRLAQMGTHVAAHFPFRTAVLPALERLVAATGESAHFVCLDGAKVVFVANVLPSTSVASVIPDNLSLDWDDTALGIALVSALPEADLAGRLRTAVDGPAAEAKLRAARTAGYAVIARHETRRIFEIAAPVRSDWGGVVGAVGITGPALRFSPEIVPAHAAAVCDIAAQALAGPQGRSLGEGKA